jgi:hypothetical protein
MICRVLYITGSPLARENRYGWTLLIPARIEQLAASYVI